MNDNIPEKTRAELEAWRRLVEAAARLPGVEDFGGVQVGPAPGGGKGRMVIINARSNIDQSAGDYVVNRYADAEIMRRGRPCEPETDVEVFAAIARIGGNLAIRPQLVNEILSVLERKNRARSPDAVRSRIRLLRINFEAFKKSFR